MSKKEGKKKHKHELITGVLDVARSGMGYVIAEGFENTPQAFIGLFSGENLGKQIVKVAD